MAPTPTPTPPIETAIFHVNIDPPASPGRTAAILDRPKGLIMIDEKTGQIDPDHPHVQRLAQLRPDQLRGLAMRLDEVSGELFHVARQPRATAQSLTGGGVPAWLVDLYNKFGPIVLDLLRAYFLREAGIDIGAGSLSSQPAAEQQSA